MSDKLKTLTANRLVEARHESLKQMNQTTMRSHGKLWGMDVFSWIHPNPELIANTLHSFPFPVIWIGNAANIMETLTEEELIMGNLHAIISYDSNVLNFKDSWLDGIKNCAGVQSIDAAWTFVNMFKAPQRVLLFSATGQDAEEQESMFIEYLKRVQIQ